MRRLYRSQLKGSRFGEGEIDRLRNLSVTDLAKFLGIEVRHGRALCFNGHDRNTPSFTINNKTNRWKCYGCNVYGDSISLVQNVMSLDFRGSCEWLLNNFVPGGTSKPAANLPNRKISKASKVSSVSNSENLADPDLYSWLIKKCGEVSDPRGLDYLEKHGISADLAKKFGVVEMRNPLRAYKELVRKWGVERVRKSGLSGAYDSLLWSGYAVIFPFFENDTIAYIQARCFGGRIKFVGLLGVKKPIYNYNRIVQLVSGQTLHICEGVPDTIAIEGKGLSAIGILGASSFRSEWVDGLISFRLVGVPDGDAGGNRFRESLVREFGARSKSIKFVSPPAGLDACDIIARVNDV